MEKDYSEEKITEEYHRWYYDTGVWQRTTFLGVECAKSVSDMWNYQEIIVELKPVLIVEFGTFKGGSALFFSSLLKMVNPESRVITVDIDAEKIDPLVKRDPHIEVLSMSCLDERVEKRIRALQAEREGRTFAILDSNHRKEHVLAEIGLMSRILKPGDYLVVEDGNINGHPVRPGWGEGPLEAITEYLAGNPDSFYRDVKREKKFGFTFAPHGFLIRR